METIEGVVFKILYHSSDTGFSIFSVETEEGLSHTVKGITHDLREGLLCEAIGSIKKDRYGLFLEAKSILPKKPQTEEEIYQFLKSGIIEGIGKANAKRIVGRFGAETLDVISKTPFRLEEIRGISKKKRIKIQASIKKHEAIQSILVFLKSHNISNADAFNIYKKWKDESIEKIKTNPYILTSLKGIGFKKADDVAQSMGIAKEHPSRLIAGVSYSLEKIAEEGHTASSLETLMHTSVTTLSVNQDLVSKCIEHLVKKGRIYQTTVDSQLLLAHPKYCRAEARVASRVLKLFKNKSPFEGKNYKLPTTLTFSESQKKAIHTVLNNKFSVITGGPGVGKTTVTKTVIDLFEKISSKINIKFDCGLCAPTGRAAKRASEATGRDSVTIHRLLGEVAVYDRDIPKNKLSYNIVIVDEASMIDARLAANLLLSLDDDAIVVFIGDPDQLPSVQPGNILHDLIESKIVPIARLTEVFRQAAKSLIVKNAYRVNSGKMPIIKNNKEDDFFFIKANNEDIASTIVELVSRRLPDKYGYTVDDIQVLAPMKVGIAGSIEINNHIQSAINPPANDKRQKVRGNTTYRVGDKVMQTSNDYDYNVFNGDTGRLVEIPNEGGACIDFDSMHIKFETDEAFSNISLSYACTIHKSQGSEYPVVIIPCTMSHYRMLTRNIFYTGITRARKMVILVGDTRALAQAISVNKRIKRTTLLKHFLISENIPEEFLEDCREAS